MSVVEGVKVPVLVALGGQDKRVPNYEGRNWVSWLKGRDSKADVRCFMYPEDGHSLDSGEAYKHSSEVIAMFLKETP